MTRLRALTLLLLGCALWLPAALIGRERAVSPLVMWGVWAFAMTRRARR